jgi:hypothetical protein
MPHYFDVCTVKTACFVVFSCFLYLVRDQRSQVRILLPRIEKSLENKVKQKGWLGEDYRKCLRITEKMVICLIFRAD